MGMGVAAARRDVVGPPVVRDLRSVFEPHPGLADGAEGADRHVGIGDPLVAFFFGYDAGRPLPKRGLDPFLPEVARLDHVRIGRDKPVRVHDTLNAGPTPFLKVLLGRGLYSGRSLAPPL